MIRNGRAHIVADQHYIDQSSGEPATPKDWRRFCTEDPQSIIEYGSRPEYNTTGKRASVQKWRPQDGASSEILTEGAGCRNTLAIYQRKGSGQGYKVRAQNRIANENEGVPYVNLKEEVPVVECKGQLR